MKHMWVLEKYRSLFRNWFLQTVFIFFILAGAFLLLSPSRLYASWFFPRLTGIGAFLHALLIAAPNLAFLKTPVTEPKILYRRHRSLTRLQTYVAIGALLGFSGTLGLFQLNFPYDKLIHFLVPLLGVIALSRFIYRWWDLPLAKAIWLTIGIALLATLVWEILEFSSDRFFGTKSFGLRGKEIFADTAKDAALDILGILAGVLAVKLRKKPWPY